MVQISYWLDEHRRQIVILAVVFVISVVGSVSYSLISNFILENDKDVTIVEDNTFIENEDLNEKKDNALVKDENEVLKMLTVDIKGAVLNPGVYEVEEGKRVQDVITLASGLREDADVTLINLSKRVEDEMVIIVYTKDEVLAFKEKDKDEAVIVPIVTCPMIPIENDACVIEESNNSDSDVENQESKISINTASLEELMTLSGIGESKARGIISYREENGGFKSIEDILNVSGIGESVFAKIKDYIII